METEQNIVEPTEQTTEQTVEKPKNNGNGTTIAITKEVRDALIEIKKANKDKSLNATIKRLMDAHGNNTLVPTAPATPSVE